MIIKLVLTGLMNSAVCQNVLHFSKDGAVFPNDANALMFTMRDFGLSGSQGLTQRQANTFKWTRLDAYPLHQPDQTPTSLIVNLPGLKVGNSFQSFAMLSFLWHLKSFTQGKRGRGRMFIPGIDPVGWNNGVMTATEQGLWDPLITNWKTRFTGPAASSGWKLRIHGKDSSEESAPVVAQIELSNKPGVQRRRNIGVGL